MISDLRTDWQRRNLGLVVTHPQVQEAADACQKLALMIGRKDALFPTLVLYGNPGCGKTTLGKRMVAWARAISFTMYEKYGHAAPLSVQSGSWPSICDGFKEGEYGVVFDFMQAGFVFLDDIGAEHDPSRNAADKLCQIFSRRESKWSIITTNIDPISWADKFDARIADRLLRRSKIVDMSEVPSYATL